MSNLPSTSVLIPTLNGQIGDTPQLLVNARDLHAFLQSKQEFATWINSRIEQYGFIDEQDFLIILSKTQNGGRPRIDYHLTLDMAKELSMVERNAKGKEARRYFIDCEKRLHQTPSTDPLTTPADRQAIKDKVYDIGNCFHHAGGARCEVNNRLRVALHLAGIADIAPHQLDTAHALLDTMHAQARAYLDFRCELDKLAQTAIIRQGQAYTPHIKKALSEIGITVGNNPNWNALKAIVSQQSLSLI